MNVTERTTEPILWRCSGIIVWIRLYTTQIITFYVENVNINIKL